MVGTPIGWFESPLEAPFRSTKGLSLSPATFQIRENTFAPGAFQIREGGVTTANALQRHRAKLVLEVFGMFVMLWKQFV